MLRFAMVAGLAACGAAAVPPAPPPPPAAPPVCDQAGANIARVLHLDGDRATAIASVVEHHCRTDAWTPVAQACVAAAVDHDAALKCAYEHLTEQQHDLVVRDMRPLLPAPPAQPETGTQAAIAERDEREGVKLAGDGDFAGASAKFRDAVARVPEPRYFVRLCESLFHEGRYAEALTACQAPDHDATGAAMRAEIDDLVKRIKDAAQAHVFDHPR